MRTVIACCALLCACSTAPQVPESVLVPVATPCIPQNMPAAPLYSTPNEMAALSDHDLILTIAAEWHELKAYVSLIAPILEACK